MKNFKIRCLLLIFIFGVYNCKDKYEAPEVTTDAANYITHNSALIDCRLISFGSTNFGNISEGICYNTTGNPTTEDFKISDTRWNDTLSFEYTNFTAFLSGLQHNTTYYVRAYIEDNEGFNQIRSTSYGHELSFTTKKVDSIVDARDNQVYKIVTIGSQVWMAENLNYNTGSGSFEYENNEKSKKLGRLYTYEGALMACPDGWHLPSDEEWKILEKKLGVLENDLNINGLRGDSIGIKLKEPGSENWENTNMYSTNEIGFTAIPGGIYNWYSEDEAQISDLRTAFYLTSTLIEDSQNVYIRLITSYENGIERKTLSKNFGYSVRCIKD